jgi:hypothetical protein
MTAMNLLHSLITNVGNTIALPEPTALLFVGTLMLSLGNLQRRVVRLAGSAKQSGKTA